MEPPVSKLYDLELELMSCDWMLDKVRSNDAYAQNLYAALCNNEFIKNDVWPVLQDKRWSCSWRYAGGIIADMRKQGDYLDWYCSGIATASYDDVADEIAFRKKQFVPEGEVTEEVKTDLFKMGWIVIQDDK